MKKGRMLGRQVFCALSFAVAWTAVSSGAEDVWHWRAEKKGTSYYLVSYPENWTNEIETITGTPPRGARVVALEKPTEIEAGQWYFQRYVQHLPSRGEIVLFDRSWYNRAGVERVMGFCTEKEYQDFVHQAPEFERHLVSSGIHLIKFWFSVSRAEQRRRFKERENHPLKQWKLSPIDRASLDKWDDYTRAKEAMFFETDTADCPWTVVKSDCKKRARLNAMRYVLMKLPYAGRDVQQIGKLDPLIVGRAHMIYERGEMPELL